MNRTYIILAVSLIVSAILFYILMNVQDKVKNEKELVEIFYAKKDIDIYENVDKVNLTKIYIESALAKELNILTKIDADYIFSSNVKSGEVIYSNMIMKKDESLKKSSKEIIGVKLKSQGSISDSLNDNTYINIYVKVSKKYLPSNYLDLKRIEYEDSEYVTFLYFEQIRPVKLMNKDGGGVEKGETIENISLEVSPEQAIYINYIRDVAEFHVSIV